MMHVCIAMFSYVIGTCAYMYCKACDVVWWGVEVGEQCVLCIFVMYVCVLFVCGTSLKTRRCISRGYTQ